MNHRHSPQSFRLARRRLLGRSLAAPVAGRLAGSFRAALAVPAVMPAHSWAAGAAAADRILVVVELSGGNDGLNTVVPYADDHYHRLRPNLAIRPPRVRRLDDRHGLNPGMAGFERLYRDGRLAIVHGCGYDQPSFSHFASMAFWHTAAPNSGEQTGWVGRLADALRPDGPPNFLVNIGASQSLAVRSRRHVPVVFDDPERFVRQSRFETRDLVERHSLAGDEPNATRRFLHDVAQSARDGSQRVRDACARYRTPVDYGILPLDLPKVAALIAAGMPTRLYYVAFRNNAFDTHVHQLDLHQRLLTYASDAISGFLRDMERIGRADDVVLLAFSEFGRRVPENANLGTDHGTAGPMFLAGKPVRGGQYGEPVDLANLAVDDNLRHTTDFRRVYSTVVDGWLGVAGDAGVLRGDFEPFPVFG